MSEWINVEKELPNCDGLYEVTNDPSSIQQQGCLEYDGIGFVYLHAYRPVKFWRNRVSLTKRYGKLTDKMPEIGNEND